MRCGGCRSAAYCSRKCQKQHWRGGHKHQCQAVPRSAGSRAAKKKPAVVALMKMLSNEQCMCDPRNGPCANGCRLRSNGMITSPPKQATPSVMNCLRKVVSFIHQTGALICTVCRNALDASERKQAFVADACPPVAQTGRGTSVVMFVRYTCGLSCMRQLHKNRLGYTPWITFKFNVTDALDELVVCVEFCGKQHVYCITECKF